MKIEQQSIALPSRVVGNDDVVALIGEQTRRAGKFEGDLPQTLDMIAAILKRSGAEKRHWLAPDESPLDLIEAACLKAMKGLRPKDIELLIYASVCGELFEPATANLVAHRIGLGRVECFDLKEACDGWMKAVKIASSFIEAGIYRRVMVVNGECTMVPGCAVFPELFALRSADQLEWRFPGFTVGEAATATILGPDPANRWSFTNETRNDLFDLCTITFPWHRRDPSVSTKIARDGNGLFTSYGAELRRHGLPAMVELFERSGIDRSAVDILFTHASSKSDWAEAARRMGLGHKIYDIYASTGNLVSASVPAAMALAEEDDSLKHGMQVAVCVASAGMSFSTASFRF